MHGQPTNIAYDVSYWTPYLPDVLQQGLWDVRVQVSMSDGTIKCKQCGKVLHLNEKVTLQAVHTWHDPEFSISMYKLDLLCSKCFYPGPGWVTSVLDTYRRYCNKLCKDCPLKYACVTEYVK